MTAPMTFKAGTPESQRIEQIIAAVTAAFALNADDLDQLEQDIYSTRAITFEAAYAEAASLFDTEQNDESALDDDDAADQQQQSHAAALSIANTYHNSLANQVQQQLLQLLPSLGEHLEGAEKALATGIGAWAGQRAGWKSKQVANYEAGSAADAGTNKFVDDMLSGEFGLPEGVSASDVYVTILPEYSSPDTICGEFAGNVYTLDQYYDLPDYPAHGNCIHEKVIVLGNAVDAAAAEDEEATFTQEEQIDDTLAQHPEVQELIDANPEAADEVAQQVADERARGGAGGNGGAADNGMRNLASNPQSEAQLTAERDAAQRRAQDAFDRAQAAAQRYDGPRGPNDDWQAISQAVRSTQADYNAAQYDYERAEAKLSAAQGGRGAIIHIENYPLESWSQGQATVEDVLRKMFGRDLTRDELGSLVGAPEGAYVRLTTDGKKEIVLNLHGPAYDPFNTRTSTYDYFADRTLTLRGKSLVMHNDLFLIDKSLQGTGLGTSIFADEAHSLSDLGVSKIETTGARSAPPRGMNGYYTWPRLGYTGKLEQDITDALKDAAAKGDVPAAWAKYTRVEQLMKTPEGAAWWKANGEQIDLSFSLKPGSKNLQLLDAYTQARAELAAMKEAERLGGLAYLYDQIDGLTTGPKVVKWLQQRYPNIEFALKGANVDVLKDASKALVRMAEQYPDPFAELKFFGLSKDPASAPYMDHFFNGRPVPKGWGGGQFKLSALPFRSGETGSGILFPSAKWSSAATMQKVIDTARVSGYWLNGAQDVGYVVTHEFGHVVQAWLEESPAISDAVRQEYNDILHDTTNYQLGFNGYPATVLDEYAISSADEMFAEGFNAQYYGDAQQQQYAYVQRIQQLLDVAEGRASADVLSGAAAPEVTPAEETTTPVAEVNALLQQQFDAFTPDDYTASANSLADQLASNADFQKLYSVLGLNDPDMQRVLATVVDLEGGTVEQETARTAVDQLIREYHTYAGSSSSARPIQVALQEAAKAEFGLADAATFYSDAQRDAALAQYGDGLPGMQALLRQMHDNTQAWFQSQGISDVTVYRGMRWSAGSQPQGLAYDGTIAEQAVELQSLSSFSISFDVASQYASGADYGMVVSDTVPVAQILSTGFTGFGAPYMGEVLLLGGTTDMQAAGFEQATQDVIKQTFGAS